MDIAGFGLHYRAFNALSQLPEADQAAIRRGWRPSPTSLRASGPRARSEDRACRRRST